MPWQRLDHSFSYILVITTRPVAHSGTPAGSTRSRTHTHACRAHSRRLCCRLATSHGLLRRGQQRGRDPHRRARSPTPLALALAHTCMHACAHGVGAAGVRAGAACGNSGYALPAGYGLRLAGIWLFYFWMAIPTRNHDPETMLPAGGHPRPRFDTWPHFYQLSGSHLSRLVILCQHFGYYLVASLCGWQPGIVARQIQYFRYYFRAFAWSSTRILVFRLPMF